MLPRITNDKAWKPLTDYPSWRCKFNIRMVHVNKFNHMFSKKVPWQGHIYVNIHISFFDLIVLFANCWADNTSPGVLRMPFLYHSLVNAFQRVFEKSRKKRSVGIFREVLSATALHYPKWHNDVSKHKLWRRSLPETTIICPIRQQSQNNTGPCVNMKTLFPVKPSYLYKGNPFTGKTTYLYCDCPRGECKIVWFHWRWKTDNQGHNSYWFLTQTELCTRHIRWA